MAGIFSIQFVGWSARLILTGTSHHVAKDVNGNGVTMVLCQYTSLRANLRDFRMEAVRSMLKYLADVAGICMYSCITLRNYRAIAHPAGSFGVPNNPATV